MRKQFSNIATQPSLDDLNRLKSIFQNGHYDHAERIAVQLNQNYPDNLLVLNILCALYLSTSRKEHALKAAMRLVELSPRNADLYNNLGVVHMELKKFAEAKGCFQRAIKFNPKFAKAHYNLGNVLKKLNSDQQAVLHYESAVKLQPEFAEAHYQLGLYLMQSGSLERAGESLQYAVRYQPSNVTGLCQLGYIQLALKKPTEAHSNFEKAASLMPDSIDANLGFGISLMMQNRTLEAIHAFSSALTLDPKSRRAVVLLGDALRGVEFKQYNPKIQNQLISMLTGNPNVRPSEVSHAAVSLIKNDPKFKMLNSKAGLEHGYSTALKLSDLTLLTTLMCLCPIPDIEIEALLRDTRAGLVFSALKKHAPQAAFAELLSFQSALAQQCHINDYLYSQTEDEEEAVTLIEESVVKLLDRGEQPSTSLVLCLASYRPLSEYEWVSRLNICSETKHVIRMQVTEPKREADLRALIEKSRIVGSVGAVSAKVQRFYESSPYPKWIRCGSTAGPFTITELVEAKHLFLSTEHIKEVERPDILVAGCGTGQQAIEAACGYKDANVMAIDLSVSSLAYVMRRTEELQIGNIKYFACDILALEGLEKKFDIIESVGVLHHMGDPVQGLDVLTDCLKPGGLIKIGLYSRIARQHITTIRKEIDKQDRTDDAFIKSFRELVIQSEDPNRRVLINSPDFFSMGGIKDLLFHVQEKQFNLLEIKTFLDDLGLVFCGFELNSNSFGGQFFTDTNQNPSDLEEWHQIELDNPRIFSRMYQFWCQKIR